LGNPVVEAGAGRFQYGLGSSVSCVDDAGATLKDGLLEVRIPKKTPTEVKKHKVAIK
jgi:hypothetical protein